MKIPYIIVCKERGDNCLCNLKQRQTCSSAKKIVDEEKLKKC